MQEKLFCIAGLPTLPDGLTQDLLECNSNDECPRRLGKCHFMFSQTPSGKNGFCVPSTCQSNVECPSFGDECTSGRLSGNSFHNSLHSPMFYLLDKRAFIYDVRCFSGIFDLPTTYPHQILYYIKLFSKIR